jgi:hypothetical protein
MKAADKGGEHGRSTALRLREWMVGGGWRGRTGWAAGKASGTQKITRAHRRDKRQRRRRERSRLAGGGGAAAAKQWARERCRLGAGWVQVDAGECRRAGVQACRRAERVP